MKQQVFNQRYLGFTHHESHKCAIEWLEGFIESGEFKITAINIYAVETEVSPRWCTHLTIIAEQKE